MLKRLTFGTLPCGRATRRSDVLIFLDLRVPVGEIHHRNPSVKSATPLSLQPHCKKEFRRITGHLVGAPVLRFIFGTVSPGHRDGLHSARAPGVDIP